MSGRGSGGLRFSPASALVSKALEAVREAERTPEELARDVLGISGASGEVARRLAAEILEGHDDVTFRDGKWRTAGRREPGGARLEMLDYVVVDVETTGVAPSRGHRVTEIAAVQVSGGCVAGEFSTLVNPGRPIPARIRDLTGITDEMVADAPSFEDVSDVVRKELEDRVFVAHNVPFDWRFLTAEMRRARSLAPDGPRLCTLRLARRALPGLSRKGLDAVSRHFDVEIAGRHRALGDALATATVLLRLLEEVDRLGLSRWDELQRWLGGGPAPADR